jgi:hypothetical protein
MDEREYTTIYKVVASIEKSSIRFGPRIVKILWVGAMPGWDPQADYTISAKTHHMRVDDSMFEGFRTPSH